MVEENQTIKILKEELKSKVNFKNTDLRSRLTKDSFIDDLFETKNDKMFLGTISALGEYSEYDFYNNLAANKKTIIDFCVKHPEISYNVLYWLAVRKSLKPSDFAGYSKEQIKKIPKQIREVIVHPENVYKIMMPHHINETIYYHLPQENKWEVLEWIAQHTPYKLSFVISKKTPFNSYGRKAVLEHYQSAENVKNLPKALQDYLVSAANLHNLQVENQKKSVESQRKNAREKKASWFDENGNLLKLFGLADGMEISSVEDYEFIANYFMGLDMSITDFCKQFKIDNVKGFKQMCEKVAISNPEFADYYNTISERKSRAFMALAKKEMIDVAEGNLSVKELIESSEIKRSFPILLGIGEYINKGTVVNEFARKIVDYYYGRLNSYDEYSSETEEILKRLSEKEMKFLMNSAVSSKYKNGAVIDFGTELSVALEPVMKYLGQSTREQIFNKETGVKKRLKSYSSEFRSGPYSTGSVQLMIDGKLVKSNADMVDMAETYAHSHQLFRSQGTMSRIIKAIAEGKIQNQAETETYKTQLKASVLKRIQECKTLEEYFAKHKELGE